MRDDELQTAMAALADDKKCVRTENTTIILYLQPNALHRGYVVKAYLSRETRSRWCNEHLSTMSCTLLYSGTSQIRTPLEQKNVS